MKRKTIGFFCIILLCTMALPAFGADCSGGWKVIPNYKPGRGGPCRILGLDTNVGVCQPGYEYETLCDDASNGRYRICQGPRRCSSTSSSGPPRYADCTTWDYKRDRYCPKGYINEDCRGSCESRVYREDDCTSWDYKRNRPCPAGYINRDCRGGCEG